MSRELIHEGAVVVAVREVGKPVADGTTATAQIEVEIAGALITVRPDDDEGLYRTMAALKDLERACADAWETVRWRQVMGRQARAQGVRDGA